MVRGRSLLAWGHFAEGRRKLGVTSVTRFMVWAAVTREPPLPAAPILESEPSDARKFPRVVRYDLEPSPQGAGREQHIVGADGCTLTVQTGAQLRCHTGIFALERQHRDRVQQHPHGFPHAWGEIGI